MYQNYSEYHQSQMEGKSELIIAQQKANLELQTANAKNEMQVEKKRACAEISVAGNAQRERESSDIAAERELQRTFISLTEAGEVILQRERFGEDIRGKLPVKILAVKLFSHLEDNEASALVIVLRTEAGKDCSLFFDVKNITPRSIRHPFEQNGISFGFGEKKENEIRKKILETSISIAKVYALSEVHGWYLLDRKWCYAFPGELTWKELKKCF